MYLTAHERLQVEGEIYVSINLQLKLVVEYGGDKRRENLPTTSEVAYRFRLYSHSWTMLCSHGLIMLCSRGLDSHGFVRSWFVQSY